MAKVTLRDGRVKEFRTADAAKRYAEVTGGKVVAPKKKEAKKEVKKTAKK